MRKYFFAYHSVNGIIFPFSWVEFDGLPVGGKPECLRETSPIEITEKEFDGDFKELEEKYPIPDKYKNGTVIE